jgi:hypothetical protein
VLRLENVHSRPWRASGRYVAIRRDKPRVSTEKLEWIASFHFSHDKNLDGPLHSLHTASVDHKLS